MATDWNLSDVKKIPGSLAHEIQERERVKLEPICPWCHNKSYLTHNIYGQQLNTFTQEINGHVKEVKGNYWHKVCIDRQKVWWRDMRDFWAEVSWHIKIELTCCPKPVYPDKYAHLNGVRKRLRK